MSFSTAVTGLNAASNMLSVTGNNIANVNTTGFKNSRSEFADVYSTALSSGGKTTPGSGVVTTNVAQLFGQGNLQSTGNNLDMGISGEGFFVMGESTGNYASHSYTRSGAFHTDQDGYVVGNNSKPLLCYRPNGTTVAEGFSTGVLQPLKLDASEGQPSATTAINTSFNLDARKKIVDNAVFPFVGPDSSGVVDPNTYSNSSSVTVYDSLGNSHLVTQYYVKRDVSILPSPLPSPATTPASIWDVYTTVDGKDIKGTSSPTAPTPDRLTFDNSGKLEEIWPGASPAAAVTTTKIAYPSISVAADAAPMQITLDVAGSTQLGSAFSVNTLNQDGVTTGTLSGIDISDTGIVFARFTNGQEKPLGQVAIVRFANPQGLNKVGDTSWKESVQSGVPLSGVAGSGSFGTIKSGSLESSNVELSQQLVNLIVAQQAYQANAQTITTENEVTRTLLQIR
ncbi:flagellar hook protein FlgE [Methyloterricola oryzae]|uniref:flagellar hook protein FlgE n=1 Tax=Methyloterricola oryzae TaxID=1495050 RepID=UPI0005EBBFAC|nr:flagellar hook protein FlgE [Methyloterricola oryzae]